jgi:pimeloyl-ACP methyl ester carboxylesterase
MPVVFCHGLESGPRGAKVRAMEAAGLHPISPDFQGMDLPARVARLEQVLTALPDAAPPVLVGSSFGGLVAVSTGMRVVPRGFRIQKMILCAPALFDSALRPTAPTVVLHGLRDDVVPIDLSRAFARQPGVDLIELDDDHRLSASMDRLLLEVTRSLLTLPRSA